LFQNGIYIPFVGFIASASRAMDLVRAAKFTPDPAD
jgi:hypothetical protein